MTAPPETGLPNFMFTPFALGRLHLANRIVMAPMTRYFAPGGVPSADVAQYYARRAEGGASLIISEGVFIDHPSAGYNSTVPHFHGDAALAAWRDVLAAVHAAGGKMMPQLWHVGVQPQPGDMPDAARPPSSASGLLAPNQKLGEPMSAKEIDLVIEAFAKSAAHAERLGFDGIELHGGHGYLIDSFFWHGTNIRPDEFGGDLAQRTRFAVEIVRACRNATHANFPIGLRFSQWKNIDYDAKLAANPRDLEVFLTPLVEAGVDFLHCSTRRFWEPEFPDSHLNLAGWTKKITGLPTIAVGSVGLSTDLFGSFGQDNTPTEMNLGQLEAMMAAGDFDLIAVGRALLADWEWPRKVMQGRTQDLRPFERDLLGTLF